jgi:methionine synthase I (cobalamin-dependent)
MSASNPLADLLSEKGVLLADGATGTNLFAMGLESGEAPELVAGNGAGKDHQAASGFC